MKTTFLSKACLFAMLICASPIFCACMSNNEEELQEKEINHALIVGQWVNTSDSHDHWKYESMDGSGKGKGVNWDSSEMTYEEAAKGPGLFEYYFDQTGLMRVFWMDMTNSFSNPDTEAPFVIDELSASTMTYHHGSHSYTFSRE